MRYHKIPKMWRMLLLQYAISYVESGYKLSARQFMRDNDIKQGVGKRYLCVELRDWTLDHLLILQSESQSNQDDDLRRVSRINSGALW